MYPYMRYFHRLPLPLSRHALFPFGKRLFIGGGSLTMLLIGHRLYTQTATMPAAAKPLPSPKATNDKEHPKVAAVFRGGFANHVFVNPKVDNK